MLEYATLSTWTTVSNLLPNILAALLILIIGFIVAGVAKRLIILLAAKLQLDSAFASTGFPSVVERSGFKLNIGVLVGTLVKWFIVVVFFVAALDVLNLDDATAFLSAVVLDYLPRVIVATVILFGAAIIAGLAEKFILGSARMANFKSPALLAKFAKIAILAFAVLAALNELQIATELIQMLFAGLVFAVSLALGLSFGLGGKEAAARYIDTKTRMPR